MTDDVPEVVVHAAGGMVLFVIAIERGNPDRAEVLADVFLAANDPEEADA